MLTDRSRLWALLVGILLVAAPFFTRIPVPVTALSLIMTIWSIAMITGKTPQPGKWQRIGLLLLVMMVMIVSFGTLLGRDAGTGFLILLAFLKMFEIKDKRDIYIVIYVEYFLIASNFFHTQSPWIAVYVFATVIYITSVLIYFSDKLSSLNARERLTIAGRMILQATPLMLILFVLFPRIPGPLWGLPKDAQSAITGLSDDMSPGSLSNLIQSEEVAFRVRFDGEIPAHADLYWRGPVFSKYDGQTWTSENASKRYQANLIDTSQEADMLTYTVTMEPHQRDWLFTLNYPVGFEGNGWRLTREAQLLNKRKLSSVFQYTITSNRSMENQSLFDFERKKNLHLPKNLNQQTIALAHDWREQAGDDDRLVVQQALRYFNQQPFVYTLNPPILGNEAMDDFLFETQRGFCEHYSSAFVYLMRAAGIPARVVTGYQGGEKNPVDDYLIVRQSSAHAWAEVWHDDEGWVRVDPTAAVSPDRIESGIQNAVAERDQLPAILIANDSIFLQARYQWDSFNQKWNEWVVGFDQKRQLALFKKMGFEEADWQDMVIGLIILMALAGAFIAWWIFRQGAGLRKDPIRKAYDIFCEKLAKTGASRKSSEGPQEYLLRTENKLTPDSADSAKDIIQLYLTVRYGYNTSPESIEHFIRSVRGFRPQLQQQ